MQGIKGDKGEKGEKGDPGQTVIVGGGAITNPDKYKDCVGDLQKFTETYVKSFGQKLPREIEFRHNWYVIYFSLKKCMRSAVVKLIAFIGIFMMFLCLHRNK